MMKYKVHWGKSEENEDNGIHDFEKILEILEYLHDENDIFYKPIWERQMWIEFSVEDWKQEVLNLDLGETLYIPYQDYYYFLPQVLMITLVEK